MDLTHWSFCFLSSYTVLTNILFQAQIKVYNYDDEEAFLRSPVNGCHGQDTYSIDILQYRSSHSSLACGRNFGPF